MKDNEIQNLVKLRQFVIKSYSSLEGRNEPSTVMKVRDVAMTLSTVINTIDDLLQEYVTFENEG